MVAGLVTALVGSSASFPLVVVGLRTGRPGQAVVRRDAGHSSALGIALMPHFSFTVPRFTIGTLVGIALPLYIITMAAQNLSGQAVLRGLGYRTELRPALLGTDAGAAVALDAARYLAALEHAATKRLISQAGPRHPRLGCHGPVSAFHAPAVRDCPGIGRLEAMNA